MKNVIFKLISIATFAIFIPACAPGGSDAPMGSSSGGGGYSDESGNAILEYAVDELKTEITNASPQLLATLPKTLPASKILNALSNVVPSKNLTVSRDDTELLFNYDKKTNTIYATKNFYESVAHVDIFSLISDPSNKMLETSLRSAIKNTKMKLMHEITHLGGFGMSKSTDLEARAVSIAIMDALKSNVISCGIQVDINREKNSKWPRLIRTEDIELIQKSSFYAKVSLNESRLNHGFLIHRPSLRGAHLNSIFSSHILGSEAGVENQLSIEDIQKRIFKSFTKNSNNFLALRGGNWFETGNPGFFKSIEQSAPDRVSDWHSIDESKTQVKLTRRQELSKTCTDSARYIGCNDKTIVMEEILTINKPNKVELSESTSLSYEVEKHSRPGKITFNIYELPFNPKYLKYRNSVKGLRVYLSNVMVKGVLGLNHTPLDAPDPKYVVTFEEFPVGCTEIIPKIDYKRMIEIIAEEKE